MSDEGHHSPSPQARDSRMILVFSLPRLLVGVIKFSYFFHMHLGNLFVTKHPVMVHFRCQLDQTTGHSHTGQPLLLGVPAREEIWIWSGRLSKAGDPAQLHGLIWSSEPE